MTKRAVFSLAVLLAAAWPAWGDIVLSLSDGTVDAGGGSFTATVQLTETSYDVNSYELDVKLTPIGGAVAGGVSFPEDAASSTLSGPNGYIFNNPTPWWNDPDSTSTEIYGFDGSTSFPETVGVGTYDLITAQLELTGANAGNQYQVEFVLGKSDITGGYTEFWLDSDWKRASTLGELVWSDTGTITVTGGVIPEPGSMTMLVGLAVTSLVLYRRRRKR